MSLLAVVLLAGSAATWWWASRPGVRPPPRIEAMGDMDPAVAALLRELRAAIEADPADASRRGRFGMACEANGFVGAARDAYEAAAALAPDEPRWWYREALIRWRLGESDAAHDALARALELAPSYAPAWVRRGEWLIDRGDAPAAEAAFRRAAEIDRYDPAAPIGLARVMLERREDARAADTLERLLERHPGDLHALQLLGAAYRRLGRVADAEFALAAGAAGGSSGRDPWSEETGEYRRGFAATLKAATQEAMAGRYDLAVPLLVKLREERPGDLALSNHLAEVLLSAGRRDEAVRLLEPVVTRGGGNADTHLALASAYLTARAFDAAADHAQRALALGARGARAHEIQGMIAWRRGRHGEAIRLMEEGRARDPRSAALPAWIGLIHLELGQPSAALPAFGEALRRDPMHVDALAGLALAQAALGARDDAAAALARAEQVAPDHPRVREARARLGERERR